MAATGGRWPWRARDHRRRPRLSQPRRQRGVGARRQHRRRPRLPAGAHRSRLPVADALRQISFRFAADDDQFMTIAKMRAARQLWARVAEVVGEPDAGAATVHAETSLPMMTQRDPWVNMLRTTLAAFGAGVGGADTVLVLPFDAAIPGGFPAPRRSFARRIARNTQLLLLEESHVGPGAGPGRRIVVRRGPHRATGRQAWAHFQEIEARGGFADGARLRRATRSPRCRRAAPTTSRTAAPRSPASTSSRTSPNPAAAQGFACRTVQRYAAGFEALRDRSDAFLSDRRTAEGAVAAAGPAGRAQHPRRRSPPTCWRPAASRRSTRDRRRRRCRRRRVGAGVADVAVICGTDARYGEEAAAVVRGGARRRRGAGLLAGPEKAVARRRSASRTAPDRQDQCGRGAVGPAHPIGGVDDDDHCNRHRQLRRRAAAQRADGRSRHRRPP